jgi:hypothetical protein
MPFLIPIIAAVVTYAAVSGALVELGIAAAIGGIAASLRTPPTAFGG